MAWSLSARLVRLCNPSSSIPEAVLNWIPIFAKQEFLYDLAAFAVSVPKSAIYMKTTAMKSMKS